MFYFGFQKFCVLIAQKQLQLLQELIIRLNKLNRLVLMVLQK